MVYAAEAEVKKNGPPAARPKVVASGYDGPTDSGGQRTRSAGAESGRSRRL